MAGTGYYEATVATGGQFLSICDNDWATHLESIATAAASPSTTFPLSQEPVVDTITVVVDGEGVESGWSYVEAYQMVEFTEDAVPAEGAFIEISYQIQPDCDG